MYSLFKLYTRFLMIKNLDKKRKEIDNGLDRLFNSLLSKEVDYNLLDQIADDIILNIIRVKHSIYDYKKKTTKK